MKYEIKSTSGEVLFTSEAESLKLVVEAAAKSRAILCGADLSETDLSGVDLSRAYLSRANFSGANLSGANLSRANLFGANLSGANLSGAYLSGSDLSGADLSRANLSEAFLSGASLSWADLSGANLSGVDLSRATGINKHLCTSLLFLLDQPGKIRAYKMVTAEGESPISDTKIKYEIGKRYAVNDADTDESEPCAKGISLATLDWCLRNWKDGWRILVAEFTAKDIACIPTATDGKFRVKRCKIVGEKKLADLDWPPKPLGKKS